MTVLDQITTDIIALEERNMTRILNEHGLSFDKVAVLQDINRRNPELIDTFCYYSPQGELLGYFRFSFTPEGNILVSSIQLATGSKKSMALRRLLFWAYTRLSMPDIAPGAEIFTWTNTGNAASTILQEKMGFKLVAGHRDASKFQTTKLDLIEKLRELRIDRLFSKHHGNYPVRVLAHNLPYTFVMHKPDHIENMKQAVQDGKLNPAISYVISDKFGMIYASHDTHQICVHEQFLAFLWSFIYSVWVINEVGIQAPILARGDDHYDGSIDNSREIVKRAQELYIWCYSLPKKHSVWPSGLPSPECFRTAEEQFYVERANGVYLKAASYLLNHEMAHLVNNHWETLSELKRKPIHELTEEEITLYKTIEQEADRFAREEMIDPHDSEQEKFITGLSIVLAHCASLFAILHPSGLNHDLHPDLDDRLFHAVNFLQLEDKKNIGYIYFIASLSMNIFIGFNKNALGTIGFTAALPASIEDPQGYFTECLKLIDRIKLKYSEM